jgi:cytochrome c
VSSQGWWAVGVLATLSLVAASAAPNAVRGEELYNRCVACHSLARDRVGPRHCGLFGRLAGTVPGFAYSSAMKDSNIVWDEKTLDRFLAAPLKVIPGTTMTYDGIADPKDRTDLIVYLKRANTIPECVNRASISR